MTSADADEPALETPAPHQGRAMQQRLIVLGAGYVGEGLCRRAVARGVETTALTRNPAAAKRLSEAGVRVVVADLAKQEWHAAMPAGGTHVVVCVSGGDGSLDNYRHSYLRGMDSVVAWGRSRPRGDTLVYTSSTSVYPQGDGLRVDETAPTEPPASERAEILLRAEETARSWPGRTFILRLSGIYGPGRHYLLDQLRAGEPVLGGRGDHRLNLVHRDDIVEAIWLALTAPATIPGQVFNVTDDEPVTKEACVQWLCSRLNRASPLFSGLAAPGRQRLTPDRVIDNLRIRKTLGWRPQYPGYRDGYDSLLGA